MRVEILRRVDRFFSISPRGSSLSREVQAGCVNFAASCYIIAVNPLVLEVAGIDRVTSARSTIFLACVLSSLLGLISNVPFTMGPGMGLNTMFAYELVKQYGLESEQANACCLAAGILLALITVSNLTSRLLSCVPQCQKQAVVIGIGVFQCLIGMLAVGFIKRGRFSVLELGNIFGSAIVWQGILTLALLALFVNGKVPGAVLVGMGTSILLAYGCGTLDMTDMRWKTFSDTSPLFLFKLKEMWQPVDFKILLARVAPLLVLLTFLIVFVDISGTITGLSQQAGPPLLTTDGIIKNEQSIFLIAAFGQVLAAFVSCSPPIIYLESAAGISQGGRTGATAVTSAVLFGASSFFLPLVQYVPPTATAPVMVLVGCYMMKAAKNVNWDNLSEALPAFLTVTVTAFSCSICQGLISGFAFSAILAAPDLIRHRMHQVSTGGKSWKCVEQTVF